MAGMMLWGWDDVNNVWTKVLVDETGRLKMTAFDDIGAKVYHDADQSIPNATVTTVAFNSERWDTDGCHDTITNNERLTCKTAGKYLILFSFDFESNATGYRYVVMKTDLGVEIACLTITATLADRTRGVISTIHNMAVDDYVYIRVYQNSGGALVLSSIAQRSPEFMMQKIG